MLQDNDRYDFHADVAGCHSRKHASDWRECCTRLQARLTPDEFAAWRADEIAHAAESIAYVPDRIGEAAEAVLAAGRLRVAR